jgi:hypothetical protein
VLASCERQEPSERKPERAATAATVVASDAAAPPAILYLPDGGDRALEGERPTSVAPPASSGRCAPDMVDVGGSFCVDRYEASLVDVRLARPISPYFAPQSGAARRALDAFLGSAPRSPAPELPRPPGWELLESFAPKAESRASAVPNGYVSGLLARTACENAGKRLCTRAEWVRACRGERNRKFPYGDNYEPNACNVYREAHPAQALWGNASTHHLDPRLNLVEGSAGPLLHKTGETSRCRSEWGPDSIFDMVGNIDEWVDEPGGAFLGGFYARATVNGCDAIVNEHPVEYFDYSTGVRCCR